MLRLTGGEFRGRLIKTPPDTHTRPTQARLRQALFNSIQASVSGSNVLDLFAGSGTLGFEALSRGAESATFVENVRSVAKLIDANAEILKVETRVHVIMEPVDQSFVSLERYGPYDIILADPPYAAGWETKLIEMMPWTSLLAPSGLFILEWGRVKSEASELPDDLPFLVKIREKIYGDSVLTTYQKK